MVRGNLISFFALIDAFVCKIRLFKQRISYKWSDSRTSNVSRIAQNMLQRVLEFFASFEHADLSQTMALARQNGDF